MSNSPPPLLENADILWQESGAPYSSRFGDIYFSREGGLEETEYVFLAANRLQERWRERDTNQDTHDVFTIAELGFGTSLNFLCTWRAWRALALQRLRLHYIACEQYPLRLEDLRRALSQWPELTELSEALLRVYPDHSAGYHRLHLPMPGGLPPVTLDLYYGDATETLAAQPDNKASGIDAWYLDGFAPRVNPQMWTEKLLQQLARLSRPGTSLSTYSVAGAVVRGLQAAGFEVEKHKGFGKKREMLRGTLISPSPATTQDACHWLDLKVPAQQPRQAIVIGGGLAGCATARALARKGIRVTLLERSNTLASAASGNRQGVLQCRLSNAANATRQFNLQSYLYAVREMGALANSHSCIQWHPCGVLNLDTAFSSRQQRCEPVNLSLYADAVATTLEREQASIQAGLTLDDAATCLPLGGWLHPPGLCEADVDHPLIEVRPGCEVDRIQLQGTRWQALDADGTVLAEGDALVVATSYLASQFTQTSPIPIVPIRGQLSYVEASPETSALSAVVCGQSYVSPAWEGLHSVGASYSKDLEETALTQREHEQNLAGIAPRLPSGSLTLDAIRGGRASIRATTKDRMPIVGPVPDFAAFEQHYESLDQGERKHPNSPMPCLPGLYVSIGHGSHGLGNTPLAGEYLASLIAGEMLPLQRDLVHAVHPGRFLLREIRRRAPSPRKTA